MVSVISDRNRAILKENIAQFQQNLKTAILKAGRNESSVVPIIVTKYQPLFVFPTLMEMGFSQFGESRVLEAVRKKDNLEKEKLFPKWHLIGSLQKNKVGKALSCFNTLHVIDSLELAYEIAKRMPNGRGSSHSFFIQVNPVREESKHGFSVEELMKREVLEKLSELLGRSQILGIMSMAPNKETHGDTIVHQAFSKVQNLYNFIRNEYIFDEVVFQSLSMGMSQDFDIAIQYGATHIRVGSCIFCNLEIE